jgi:hypothetical protein
MTDSSKPANKSTAKALLDELSSIRSLLSDSDMLADGSKDVPHSSLLDDEVPLLDPIEVAATEEGDSHQQIPLLDSAEAKSEQKIAPTHKVLSERENPFLPRKPQNTAPAPQPTHATPASHNQPANADMHALVEQTLAEWLPKIEQDLRQRLLALLKKPS